MVTRRIVFEDVRVAFVGRAELYFQNLWLFLRNKANVTKSFVTVWSSATPTASEIPYQPLTTTEDLRS